MIKSKELLDYLLNGVTIFLILILGMIGGLVIAITYGWQYPAELRLTAHPVFAFFVFGSVLIYPAVMVLTRLIKFAWQTRKLKPADPHI